MPTYYNCGLGIRDIAFTPDNMRIVVSTTSREIQFWNIKNSHSSPSKVFKLDNQFRKLEFSEDKKWLLALDFDARFLDIWNFEKIDLSPIHLSFPNIANSSDLSKIECYCFDLARNWIWISNTRGSIAAWSLSSKEMVIPIFGLDGTSISSITTNRNNHNILFGTNYGNIFEMNIDAVDKGNLSSIRMELNLLSGNKWDKSIGEMRILSVGERLELAKKMKINN